MFTRCTRPISTDPESVDKAWWDFFADYSRSAPTNGDRGGRRPPPQRAPAPVEPAPAPCTDPVAAPAPPRRRRTAPCRRRQPADAPAGRTLKGAAARTVANMEASLAVPTATSVRAVPAKLLIDNRVVINNHLRRGRGGKVSFTHLIGYALVTRARASTRR